MSILGRIEKRVVLPGDSETRRSQKTLSTALFFVGSLSVLLNAFSYLSLGMTEAGLLYVGWSILVLSAAVLILAIPRLWSPLTHALFIGIIVITFITHIYSGGFQSGLEAAIWMLLAPVGAALFFGRRFTIILLVIYTAGVVIAAFLEPFAQSIAPDLDLVTRMRIASGNLVILGILVTTASLYLLRQVDYYRRRADDLLLNMLPGPIATRLKERKETIADSYSDVTVLFADMVGSTPLFANLKPAEAVDWLNEVFSMFDRLVDEYSLEKIRTIGDNYMVAAGVPTPREDHAQAMTAFALDLVRGLEKIPARHGKRMSFRVGIHTGPLVAGVIGESKYQYDLWGDTVNIASRMESHGAEGKIHISPATYELVKDEFECASRGAIPVKGRGEMETWFVVDRKV